MTQPDKYSAAELAIRARAVLSCSKSEPRATLIAVLSVRFGLTRDQVVEALRTLAKEELLNEYD